MANNHRKVDTQLVQEVLLDDPGFLREIVERVVQQLLEVEMTHHIGSRHLRANREAHRAARNGYKPRTLRPTEASRSGSQKEARNSPSPTP